MAGRERRAPQQSGGEATRHGDDPGDPEEGGMGDERRKTLPGEQSEQSKGEDRESGQAPLSPAARLVADTHE